MASLLSIVIGLDTLMSKKSEDVANKASGIETISDKKIEGGAGVVKTHSKCYHRGSVSMKSVILNTPAPVAKVKVLTAEDSYVKFPKLYLPTGGPAE